MIRYGIGFHEMKRLNSVDSFSIRQGRFLKILRQKKQNDFIDDRILRNVSYFIGEYYNLDDGGLRKDNFDKDIVDAVNKIDEKKNLEDFDRFLYSAASVFLEKEKENVASQIFHIILIFSEEKIIKIYCNRDLFNIWKNAGMYGKALECIGFSIKTIKSILENDPDNQRLKGILSVYEIDEEMLKNKKIESYFEADYKEFLKFFDGNASKFNEFLKKNDEKRVSEIKK